MLKKLPNLTSKNIGAQLSAPVMTERARRGPQCHTFINRHTKPTSLVMEVRPSTYFSEQLDPALYYLRPLNNLNLTMTLKDDNHNCTLNFNLEKGVRRRLNYTTQWSEDGTRETKSNRS